MVSPFGQKQPVSKISFGCSEFLSKRSLEEILPIKGGQLKAVAVLHGLVHGGSVVAIESPAAFTSPKQRPASPPDVRGRRPNKPNLRCDGISYFVTATNRAPVNWPSSPMSGA